MAHHRSFTRRDRLLGWRTARAGGTRAIPGMRYAGTGHRIGRPAEGAPMDLGLAGKRALIVGGNRGIGFGIAKALVEEGADVAIAARDIARLSLAASELQKSARGKVTTAEFDLGRTDEIPSFAKALIERFGPIDILLNNTGG